MDTIYYEEEDNKMQRKDSGAFRAALALPCSY
jgi:hypothetical protein